MDARNRRNVFPGIAFHVPTVGIGVIASSVGHPTTRNHHGKEKEVSRKSNDELKRLCAEIPYMELTDTERLAALRFKRRQADDTAVSVEAQQLLEDQRQLTIDEAYRAIGDPTYQHMKRFEPEPLLAKTTETDPEPTPAEDGHHIAMSIERQKPNPVTTQAEEDTTTMLTFIDEKDIPADGIHSGSADTWLPAVRQLKAHSGEWAILRVFPSTNRRSRKQACQLAGRINRGDNVTFRPKGDFQAIVRTPDKHADTTVYCRHNPKTQSPDHVDAGRGKS